MKNQAAIRSSRYGDGRYVEEIGDKEYLLYGKSHFVRWIGDNMKDPESIDFEGGPFVSKGDDLKDFGYYKNVVVDKFEGHPGIKRPWLPDEVPCFKIIAK